MVDYKIVKYCRRCKVRFVVSKGEAKTYFCNKCQLIANRERNKEE